MDDSTKLNVTPTVSIPRSEIQYRASRASGPGGQHVNTSSTRVELLWDLPQSVAITDDERARLCTKLAGRLDAAGMVRVVASDRRSQGQNKQAADVRLAALIARALHVPKRRKPTRPTRAAKERRLADKKHRGEIKRTRGGPTEL